MSRFISVSMEAPAIIDVTSKDVVSHKIRNNSRAGVNLEVANILDKYVTTQKNRMQEECIRTINFNCMRIKSKLLNYARNPVSEVTKLLEQGPEQEPPLRLSSFINKIIDVNQKYEKPISQKLGIVNEVASIEKYKEFKRNFIQSKHRSDNSPNCRQMTFILKRSHKMKKESDHKPNMSVRSPVVEQIKHKYVRSIHPSIHHNSQTSLRA